MQVDCGFDSPGVLVQLGPTLPVRIGFDPVYQQNSVGVPNLPKQLYPALVDTGAQESCIDSGLAAALQLPIVDRQTISGAHGAEEVNMHLGQIYVPALDFTTYGRFAGVHLTAGGQPHYALIGRTFLSRVYMSYDGGSGKVEMVLT